MSRFEDERFDQLEKMLQDKDGPIDVPTIVAELGINPLSDPKGRFIRIPEGMPPRRDMAIRSGRSLRIRRQIFDLLKERKVMDTSQIVEALQDKSRHGVLSAAVNKILPSDPRFQRVGSKIRNRIDESSYPVAEWSLRNVDCIVLAEWDMKVCNGNDCSVLVPNYGKYCDRCRPNEDPRKGIMMTVPCANCGSLIIGKRSDMRKKMKRNTHGVFCNGSCAGRVKVKV